MDTFKLRFKPFDVFMTILLVIIFINNVVKYIAENDDIHGFYAFLALMIWLVYAKVTSIINDI